MSEAAPKNSFVWGPDPQAYHLAWCIDGRSYYQEVPLDSPLAALEGARAKDGICIAGEWLFMHSGTEAAERYEFQHSPGGETFTGRYFGDPHKPGGVPLSGTLR